MQRRPPPHGIFQLFGDADFGPEPFFVDGDGCYGPRADEDLTQHDPPWTRHTHPYNYDPCTIWGEPRPNKACNGTVYTDRLEQWDRAKYACLARKHYRSGTNDFERPFDAHNCKGHLIEAFLRDWLEDPQLKLLRVVEYCNPGTGYPTWRLDFTSTKEGYGGL
jgi:hypothetical protein